MSVLDLLFPISCLNCKKQGVYICSQCLSKVARPRLFCLNCGRASVDGATHSKCKKKYSINYAYALWNYEGVIRKSILRLKYNFAYDIAKELAGLCINKLKETPVIPKKAILVPVPLHKFRQNWRGFNQSEIVGKLIAEGMKWEYCPNVLIRKKFSKPQVELKGLERKKNVGNVFAFNPNCSPSQRLFKAGGKLQSTNYILFDDVMTTGSTLKEAAKVLKRCKVPVVWGLTVAA